MDIDLKPRSAQAQRRPLSKKLASMFRFGQAQLSDTVQKELIQTGEQRTLLFSANEAHSARVIFDRL